MTPGKWLVESDIFGNVYRGVCVCSAPKLCHMKREGALLSSLLNVEGLLVTTSFLPGSIVTFRIF